MKLIPLALLTIAIGVAAWASLHPACNYMGASPHSRILGSVIKIKSLISTLDIYRQEHVNNNSPRYPAEIKDLISENLLTESELRGIMQGMQIDYFPPSSPEPAENQILIVGHVPAIASCRIPGYVIYGRANGDIRYDELK